MKIVYLVPKSSTSNEMRTRFHERELDAARKRDPRRQHSILSLGLDEATEEFVRDGDERFSTLLRHAVPDTLFVLDDPLQIKMKARDFVMGLDRLKSKRISVRFLSPDFVLDPRQDSFHQFGSLFAKLEQGYVDEGRDRIAVRGEQTRKVSYDDFIQIRAQKRSGVPLRVIAESFGVSIGTIAKYTSDIPGVSPAVRLKERNNRELDLSFLDDEASIKVHLRNFLLGLRSQETTKAYHAALKEFISFATSSGSLIHHPNLITEKLLNEFMKAQFARGLSKATVAGKMSAISAFCKYCFKRRIIEESPVSYVRIPTVERSEVKTEAMTKEELASLLKLAKSRIVAASRRKDQVKYQLARRNFLLCLLLASTGMRVGALLDLRVSDLKNRKNLSLLTLRTKGNNEYVVTLDETTSLLLDEYIVDFIPGAKGDEYVFTTCKERPRPLKRINVWQVVSGLAKHAGIQKSITPHSFRVTFATLAHHGGMPMNTLKNVLNHKSIATTSAYVKKADAASVRKWMPNVSEMID